MKRSEDNQIPHPELQALLPRLVLMSPWHQQLPAFTTRDEAEKYLAYLKNAGEKDVKLQPVWSIDHGALDESRIMAWSVVPAAD